MGKIVETSVVMARLLRGVARSRLQKIVFDFNTLYPIFLYYCRSSIYVNFKFSLRTAKNKKICLSHFLALCDYGDHGSCIS